MIRSLLISFGLMVVAVLLFVGTMLAVLNFQGTPIASLFERGSDTPVEVEDPPWREEDREQGFPTDPKKKLAVDSPARPTAARLFDFPGAGAQAPAEARLPARLSVEEIDALAENLMTLRAEFERRRKALDEREAGLAQREEELLARRRDVRSLQDQVDRSLRDLEAAKARWEADQVVLEASERQSIRRLADMVSEMRPDDAAESFNRWLPAGRPKIVKILAAMDPSAAAKVLEKLDPKQAHEIFEALTRYREQRADPPRGG